MAEQPGSTLHPALAWLVPALLCAGLLAGPSPARADEALTYDANGNVLTRTLPGGTTTFGYDALDRLGSEAGPARTQSFTLDANGNRLSDGQGSKTYSPNSNRMATLDGHSVVLDAAGHTLQARGLVFAWNQAGQLKSVSQGPTLLASYFYDHRGLRTRKTTTAAAPQGAGTVIYHHDAQGHLLAETSAAGAPLRTYVWREDTPQALIVHAGGGNKVLYLETDHLGSPIAARDQSGRLVWKWESDAFGGTAPNEDPDGDGSPTTIHLRFPGQYFDAESALHYNWHRYYDPTTGRYLSPDPIGVEGGSNLFGYVDANPLSYIDPQGLWSVTIGAYMGVGGQMTFGNDGGNGFMTARFGFGLGGGASYNPTGSIPGPAPQNPSSGGVVLSCSAKANFNAGPLSASLEKGAARNYSNAQSSMYGGASASGRDRFTGLGASGSFGGQITIYSGRK